MPIDLVIDERETGPSGTKAEGLPGDSNNNANRSNADSASHTDGASTPEVVSQISRLFFCPYLLFKSIMGQSTFYHVYEETPKLLRQTMIYISLLFPCILLDSQISDMRVIELFSKLNLDS